MNSLEHLSGKQKECIQATFSFLDTNKDGHLNQDETLMLLRCLGQTGSSKDLLKIIKETQKEKKENNEDKTIQNEIDINIFLKLFQQHYTAPINENLLCEAFRCFDEEFKGKITLNELQRILTCFGTEPFRSDELNVLLTHLKTVYGEACTLEGIDTYDFIKRLISGPCYTPSDEIL